MHVDDGQLQRLVDTEFAGPMDDIVREHVAECGSCRERIATARRDQDEILALLGNLDHVGHVPNRRAVVTRARGQNSRWMVRAAGFLAAAALAGVAYAVPGSPLQGIASRIFGGRGSSTASVAPTASSAPASTPTVSGVTVAAGKQMVIDFTSKQSSGSIRVGLSDDPEIAVRAIGGGATFSSAEEALTVNNEGSTASYTIVIPRVAPSVEIRVGSSRVLAKNGDRIVSDYAISSDGTYLIPFTPKN